MKGKKTQADISLGEKIRFYRKRLCMTQEDLAFAAGLGTGTISEIENNIVTPQLENIYQLAIALKLTAKEVAYVFGVNLYINTDGEERKS